MNHCIERLLVFLQGIQKVRDCVQLVLIYADISKRLKSYVPVYNQQEWLIAQN